MNINGSFLYTLYLINLRYKTLFFNIIISSLHIFLFLLDCKVFGKRDHDKLICNSHSIQTICGTIINCLINVWKNEWSLWLNCAKELFILNASHCSIHFLQLAIASICCCFFFLIFNLYFLLGLYMYTVEKILMVNKEKHQFPTC